MKKRFAMKRESKNRTKTEITRREFMQYSAAAGAALAIPGLLGGCSSDSGVPSLTVTTSIQTSDAQEALATVDPQHEIILTFSEPLNVETVEGMVSLHTVKVGGELTPTEPCVEISVDAQKPTQVIIRTEDGSKLLSGEEYKLVVGSGVTAASGLKMSQEYVRYFATDYDLSLDPIPELGNDRTITYVISDIHMGDQRSIDGRYCWFNDNRDKLVSFLNFVRQQPNAKELVIAGDLFDEWVAPMDVDTFNGTSQSGFVDMIVAANQPVIDAFNAIIEDGEIKVTYVPGNHCMLVKSEDIQRVFPGIAEARGAQGLGAYTPTDRPELVIEHGHRYDFFNAPDPISNRSITKPTLSILPPGFFVSKIAASSDLEKGLPPNIYREGLSDGYSGDDPGYYLTYWAAWKLIMKEKPVEESWDAKIIRTGIDGYTDMYAINDLIPRHDSDTAMLDVTLYKDIVNTWGKRQDANNVSVHILAELAFSAAIFNWVLDAQSKAQYFWNINSNKRVVVFGHTHHAKLFCALNHKLQWSIYANSGTWVDNSKVSCTFVTIIPKKDNGATTETVTVYQYIDDKTTPKKIKSAAIRN